MHGVTVVLDSQAGSCGKGKFIGYLVTHSDLDMAMDNFMTNAGHTFVTDDGQPIMTQHLPTSMMNCKTRLYIGPGAAITPKTLFDEILKYEDILGDRRVHINPNAVVIMPQHMEEEKRILRSGSTFKGCGAAQAQKVMRQAVLFGDWWDNAGLNNWPHGYNDEQIQSIKSHIDVYDAMMEINNMLDHQCSLMIEGSQGCDLDINYGLGYPHTTSRQCHAGQLVADCGVSPRLVDDIIMIMRPYPIRISNTTNIMDEAGKTLITSSGDYDGAKEISWDEVARRAGCPEGTTFYEKTTVTKKTRRVFEMNWDRFQYVAQLNRPTQIALNFAQYINYNAFECHTWSKLPQKVKDFIHKVEKLASAPVTMIGTGARNCDIVDIF